jgi:endonuclease/exonuclease/phosphatase family metal-dependent hydrolase
MKHPLILIFSFALFNAIAIFAQDAPIRVMTFNVRFSNPADGINSWENRKELVVSSLYNASPDLVGMQEVLKSQLDYVNENLPDYNSFGVGRDDGMTGGEYVPVLYKHARFSLLDQGTFWLSPTPQDTGSVGWDAALTRICSWGKFTDLSSEQEFYFLNTHFDHMGDTARIESARLILNFIEKETNGLPVILTGDFNCSPEEGPYAVLTNQLNGLSDACHAENTFKPCSEGTFNGFGTENEPRRIDMIFSRGGWSPISYEVLKIKEGYMFVSDHFPVVAGFDYLH